MTETEVCNVVNWYTVIQNDIWHTVTLANDSRNEVVGHIMAPMWSCQAPGQYLVILAHICVLICTPLSYSQFALDESITSLLISVFVSGHDGWLADRLRARKKLGP